MFFRQLGAKLLSRVYFGIHLTIRFTSNYMYCMATADLFRDRAGPLISCIIALALGELRICKRLRKGLRKGWRLPWEKDTVRNPGSRRLRCGPRAALLGTERISCCCGATPWWSPCPSWRTRAHAGAGSPAVARCATQLAKDGCTAAGAGGKEACMPVSPAPRNTRRISKPQGALSRS